jgi:3-phenylpropionate/trans-cinnamate dioxygenase ferredoxin subunit
MLRQEVAMGEFITIGKASTVKDGEMQAFEARGEQVAVANSGGSFYAFSDVCTHQGCSLSEGELEGPKVTCPCHGSEFDVTTGAVRHGPAQEAVRAYRVRVDQDSLQIET